MRVKESEAADVQVKFNLTDGNAALIIGIYLLQRAEPCNREETRVIDFQRSEDPGKRTVFTYIAADHQGNSRLWVKVVPRVNKSYRLLSAWKLGENCTALAMEMYTFSHTHSDDMKEILCDAGRIGDASARACEEVYRSCLGCGTTGGPAQHRKVSPTHINSSLNQ